MENVSLISGQVVLYERVNPFLIYPKERIITDDGHRPICAGEYSLAWDQQIIVHHPNNDYDARERKPQGKV